ncbi:MAG TPA: AVAST type 2 anti-phage system protein Avs2 [Pyrinomonadaceae bacterium]
MPDGKEWGWQAKFFFEVGKAQWLQLDESIRTALKKHPRLTTFTVCLPIDRRDPRIEGRKDLMEQWHARIEKWKEWAREEGGVVEFQYWGEHELWERLGKEDHRGRYFFWFNKELFSRQWFADFVAEGIANAGPRYTPEIHVGLPIADLFEGLGRTTPFYAHVSEVYGELKRAYSKVRFDSDGTRLDSLLASLSKDALQLFPLLEHVEDSGINRIDFETSAKLAFQINEKAWEAAEFLDEKRRTKPDAKANSGSTQPAPRQPDSGYQRHLLSELANRAAELGQLCKSTKCRLANVPALLLVGDAGTGKSHLFCDVAKRRVEMGLPTVLLLGENFSEEEPWSQIIKMLGLTCGRAEFLGALEASAQAANAKALIMIDALNEGEGKTLWRRHFAGILTALSRYPWISFAVSVRSSYESTVMPEGLSSEKIIRQTHPGFADHEYQATTTFFDFYGIKAPSVPLLNPEFQNPLFLKLFCKGLQNAGYTELPAGLQGVTAIFDFFIDSVNRKLSGPKLLDFDRASDLVQKAVNRLVDAMTRKGETWLSREEAQEIVNDLLPGRGYDKSLFRHLLAEGVIAEDRAPVDSDRGGWIDSVHFSYQRLSDHLLMKRLLDEHLDAEDPCIAFEPDRQLGALVKDEVACWQNRGIVEALCIQLPERTGRELFDCAPRCAAWQPALEAFVESLIWRRPKAIGDATLRYINEHVIHSEELHHEFLDALLTVASNLQHPYNADFLHRHLEGFSLPDRDAWWSIYLHERYTNNEHSVVHRLIDWAWSPTDKSHIRDESIRLYATALSWFLTTSNRFTRDRATKALVSLLTPRIRVLRDVLAKFHAVNDPYVTERLYAVAYGCSMRSTDDEAIGELAADIYRAIFEGGSPPVHILLRDYARGVIERALYLGIDLQIDVDKVRPPYNSEWPDDIPSKEELEGKYNPKGLGRSDDGVAQAEIVHSVMGSEDFARYVIGTNWGHFDWTSRRLDEAGQPTRREIYERFISSLTDRQKKAFEELGNVHDNFDRYLRMDEQRRRETFGEQLTEDLFREVLAYLEGRLRATLGKRKLATFEEHVKACLEDPLRCRSDYHFDLSLAQRWILQRVFDLGWTTDRFGHFDRYVNRWTNDYRTAHKPERIGKKYQWIAFHEFLARAADNFEYRANEWSGQGEKYEGPWQPSERDIDPSCLLKATGREVWKQRTNTWWFPLAYKDWGKDWSGGEPDDDWLRRSDDVPQVESLIETVNPIDGSRWLTLDGYYQWEQLLPIGEDPSENRRKEFWYILNSYIVKREDIDVVFEWAKEQDFFGRWMPESHALHQVFLGEFFWSPAYEYHNIPYFHRDGWTRGHSERIPREVLLTNEEYMREDKGFDCSMDEGYVINLPTKWIVDGMALRWNGSDGHFFDPRGDLVAFDPSVKNKGPGALLINKQKFLKFLREADCDILWTVLGEKSDFHYGMHGTDRSGRLMINGAYRILNGEIHGVRTAKFIEAR